MRSLPPLRLVPTMGARPPAGAFSFDEDIDTGLIVLPRELVDALRAIAPKRQHPKLPYVILLALLVCAGAIASSLSNRAAPGDRDAVRSANAMPATTPTAPATTRADAPAPAPAPLAKTDASPAKETAAVPPPAATAPRSAMPRKTEHRERARSATKAARR